MKIGIFTDTYYPQVNGVATSVFILKRNLERLGHEVHLFTTTDTEVKKGERNVYRVPSIPVLLERRLAMFYHPRLARKIKKLNLDIIHTHTEFSLGIFGRIMAKELEIPFVHTYHTIYEDCTHYIVKSRRLDKVAKMTARKMSTVFCNSANQLIVPTNKVKRLLLSYGVEREISVIPTGIKLDKFATSNYTEDCLKDIREEVGVRATDKIILYIGRISEEKNIKELLEHLQPYLYENEEVKFVLVGDGPAKKELEEMSHGLGISEQVIFAGEKPWDDVCRYYQLGDVFVSASQSETQGITYIEALAAGLPVIAKADACLEGVVEDNVNGYTFTTQNDFLKALDLVLWNDEHKRKLVHGTTKIVKKFSEERFSLNVEDFYAKAIYRVG